MMLLLFRQLFGMLMDPGGRQTQLVLVWVECDTTLPLCCFQVLPFQFSEDSVLTLPLRKKKEFLQKIHLESTFFAKSQAQFSSMRFHIRWSKVRGKGVIRHIFFVRHQPWSNKITFNLSQPIS